MKSDLMTDKYLTGLMQGEGEFVFITYSNPLT